MSGIMNMFVAAKTTIATAVDAFFNLTTLLLNTSSTNGAQNNTFLDSSTNNFSITRNGNTTQGTFTPFSQTGWSNYTSAAASNYINFTTSPGTLFQFTGDFTIEAWIYPTLLGTGESLWVTNDGGSSYLAFNITTTTYDIFLNSTGVTASITSGINLNQWNHCAMVRSGSTVTLYTNGVSKGTTTNSSTLGYANPSLNRNGGGGSAASWYMSNLRIVKGTAVYTGSTYTVPTTPLTAISGTSLLTCQSNRFLDSSSNALVATVSGTPSVQAFSPFAPTAAYDAAVVGGSGYLDGTGDYLVTPSSASVSSTLLASDFTIECWLYLTTYPGGGAPIWTNSTSNSDGFSSVYVTSSGTVALGKVGVNEVVSTATVVRNAWNHFATVRSGSTVYLYLNGAQIASGAASTYLDTSTAKPLQIGQSNQSSPSALTGYFSGYRAVSSALYTGSTYTIPTSVPTAISGTTLLLNFANSGIFDSTAKNVLETVGNAQVSTTQAKWGTTSMYFDGTGDNLYTINPCLPRSGDFTLEMWIYPTSTSGYQLIYSQFTSGSTDGNFELLWDEFNEKFNVNFRGATLLTSSSTYSLNAWHHLAIVRSGSTFTMYVDGASAATATNSDTILQTASYVGTRSLGDGYFAGYIDDLRITRGYARYSGSTYTVPTAAFPVQ